VSGWKKVQWRSCGRVPLSMVCVTVSSRWIPMAGSIRTAPRGAPGRRTAPRHLLRRSAAADGTRYLAQLRLGDGLDGDGHVSHLPGDQQDTGPAVMCSYISPGAAHSFRAAVRRDSGGVIHVEEVVSAGSRRSARRILAGCRGTPGPAPGARQKVRTLADGGRRIRRIGHRNHLFPRGRPSPGYRSSSQRATSQHSVATRRPPFSGARATHLRGYVIPVAGRLSGI
jgi:hypothetical protein